MQRTQIYLTDDEKRRLAALAESTGRSQSELIREAVDHWLQRYRKRDRGAFLDVGRGLWADRDDLPDFRALRLELDRLAEPDSGPGEDRG